MTWSVNEGSLISHQLSLTVSPVLGDAVQPSSAQVLRSLFSSMLAVGVNSESVNAAQAGRTGATQRNLN